MPNPTAVFFGDSYVGAANRRWPGYSRLAAGLLRWEAIHLGRGGTGFVKTALDGRLPYADRLQQLLDCPQDIAVIQASGNDATCDLAEVCAAAEKFFDAIATRGRFRQVYVLAPIWAGDGAEHVPALREVIRVETERRGFTYIDTAGWMKPYHVAADGGHPNRCGHIALGIRCARALRRRD